MSNIRAALMVGAGRRVSMARILQQRGYTVYAYEGSKQVPVARVVHVIEGKPWDAAEAHIAETIQEITRVHGMEPLVLPFMGEATRVLQPLTTKFSKIAVAPAWPTAVCLDKQLFRMFMLTTYPKLYPEYEDGVWPRIVKPRYGFGSHGVHTVNTPEELATLDLTDTVMQTKVTGPEFSVDAYFDKTAKFVDAVVRQRDRVAGGEVISSHIVHDSELHNWTKTIGEAIGITGPTCFQFIRTQPFGGVFIVEVNARFGGGSILSMHAGFDMVHLLEHDYYDQPNQYVPGSYRPLGMHRFNSEFYYEVN